MSETQIMPIYGRTPPCSVYRRIKDRRNEAIALKAQRSEEPVNYIEYEDSDNDEETPIQIRSILNTSYNFVDYIRSRELLLKTVRKVHRDFGFRHILTHEMFKETPIELGNIDKIFCSQWLSDRKVIFGTKCNKLMVYDVMTRSLDRISPLVSHRHTSEVDQRQGIHSVQLNPSRTLLATSAQNACDISIYSLPSLDPVCVGENAHQDRIFDICWLDDETLVSGSRDSTVALWKIPSEITESAHVSYQHISAISVKECKNSQKIRALCFNKTRKEFAALSLNGYIHVWNAETFKQISSKRLSFTQNVCMAVQETDGLYAVGRCCSVVLLDCKTLQCVRKIFTSYLRCIRSLSFQGDILTIGTGSGLLTFYDVRTGRFLESHIKSSSKLVIQAGSGHVLPDNINLPDLHNCPAIYTHCYDCSGTRLFTAGGPLAGIFTGYYASLWQ